MARAQTTRKVTPRKSVNKKKAPSTKRSKLESSKPKSSPEISDENWDEKIRAHRTRQKSISTILDQTFNKHGKNNPDLWERKAYLMLVGLVYEKLATCEEELSTNELVSLAKVLAENRRAEVRSRSEKLDTRDEEKSSSRMGKMPAGELPKDIVGTVRQLYGVDMEVSNQNNGNANSKK